MGRTILAALLAGLFLILGLPVLGIEWLYGKVNPKGADRSSLRIVQWILGLITDACGTEVIIKGEENIPRDERVLYIANHRSIFDVVISYTICPDLTGYVAKNNLEKIPILRIWMKRLHCHFLDRSDPRQGLHVILDAIEDIKHGISVFIFPEGTRTKTGEMAPFKEGSFKVATKTGCRIVPVAITGTDDIIRNHIPFVKKTTVILHYGTPVDPKVLTPDQKKHIGAYTQAIIADMLEEDKKIR